MTTDNQQHQMTKWQLTGWSLQQSSAGSKILGNGNSIMAVKGAATACIINCSNKDDNKVSNKQQQGCKQHSQELWLDCETAQDNEAGVAKTASQCSGSSICHSHCCIASGYRNSKFGNNREFVWQKRLQSNSSLLWNNGIAIGNGQQHCKRGTRVYLRLVLHESGIFSVSMHMCILENKDKKSTLLYVYYESYHHTVRTFQALISPHCYNMEKERKIFVEWSRDNSFFKIKSIQSLFSYFQQSQKYCSWL